MVKGKARTLTLSGGLGIRMAPALYADLTAALQSADEVVLDMAGVSEVDLSTLQILVAARRSAEEQGKRLSLAPPDSGVLGEALRQGGFAADDPFWQGGDER